MRLVPGAADLEFSRCRHNGKRRTLLTLDFSFRTVAISGAASAIGQEIANAFSEARARVYCGDLVPVADWPVVPGTVTAATIDLREPRQVIDWIEDVETATGGPIEILINNAGGVAGQTGMAFESVADEAWNAVIDANLTSTFNVSRAVVPSMKKAGRGVIINIGSGASQRPSRTGVQAYCAAKHAVLGLTRQLALELGPHGVRVNCIAPGFIITNNATRRQWSALGNAGQQALINSIALRRLGTPKDIANAVLMLASDYAAFITGEIVSVNGGG